MSNSELYMQRALELALRGLGAASPNPLVGCVIVENDEIIGEGWHKKYGESHAEVNAIQSVMEKDTHRLKNATCYVTLEPCAHYGKTPPCVDLIVENKIPKVVICNVDPFEKVAGKGIERLKNAGIQVETGLMEDKGRFINRRFFTSVEKKRPYIILKWAQTSDGFVARKNFDSKWISNVASRKLVHQWRAEEDAILVGYNTALYDNPKLNCRDWIGKDPLRIFIDKETRLPSEHHLLDGSVETLCYTFSELNAGNEVETIRLNSWDHKIPEILADLHRRNVRSLIVEGGSNTLRNFMEQGLWDEARVFVSKQEFGEGISAPLVAMSPGEEFRVENDLLKIYTNSSA